MPAKVITEGGIVDQAPAALEGSDRHHRIWRSVDRVKKLSDRVIGIGPFGVGMDGLIGFIPGAGLVYTVGAGGFLLAQAMRTGASAATIARMIGYLAVDTATTEIPIIGDAVDFLFPGHLMAAKALQSDIEGRHGPPPEVAAKLRRGVKPTKSWTWGRGR